MSKDAYGHTFDVMDKKNGKKMGTVYCTNFQKLASKMKPRTTALICFILMTGSILNMTSHAAMNVMETVNGIDNVRLAVATAAVETADIAERVMFESREEIEKEIRLNMQSLDQAIAKIDQTEMKHSEQYITAKDRVAELKQEMFLEEVIEYSDLYQYREVSRDLCESILEILNALTHKNTQGNKLTRFDTTEDKSNRHMAPNSGYDKRNIFKVEAVREGYKFHPKTNTQSVGGRR